MSVRVTWSLIHLPFSGIVFIVLTSVLNANLLYSFCILYHKNKTSYRMELYATFLNFHTFLSRFCFCLMQFLNSQQLFDVKFAHVS